MALYWHTKYDCESCPYRNRDVPFCGICLMMVIDGMKNKENEDFDNE